MKSTSLYKLKLCLNLSFCYGWCRYSFMSRFNDHNITVYWRLNLFAHLRYCITITLGAVFVQFSVGIIVIFDNSLQMEDQNNQRSQIQKVLNIANGLCGDGESQGILSGQAG